ncbi:hypothetical protein ELZ19_06980 [Brucella abortus]|uniref:hypothetical protein n=1 Tax=Brucella abortus TaxID=235 RepID=UPI0004E8A715|nr:hypothetical protein [Brucella abortus]KFH18454.1 hypothetical protein IB60_17265 [Brucella abortus LMN1]RUQ67314.1 hypothetical protein ELZ23_15410 [Brucella abortus]RUQ78555.1 hypothetical protein ELZ22_16915 [Brucella abortus]RUQ88297.1 hypothetical protein ELZ18_15670 [Brucella abortus]RUQ90327.1 hypothetical protein ELZ20_15670 [Brucella abortus]
MFTVTNDRDFLRKRIETKDEAEAFIRRLHELNLMFHFEDSPEDIGNFVNGEWVNTFTEEEALEVSQRVEELYSFEWGDLECPIGFALEVMGHVIE